MKATRFFLALALLGVAAVCTFAENAPAASGQNDKGEIDALVPLPFDVLIAKGQTSSVQDKAKFATAIARKTPTSKQDVNSLLDYIESKGKPEEEDILRDSARNTLSRINNPAYGPEFAKRIKTGKFRTRLISIEMSAKLKAADAVPDLLNMVKGYSKLKEKIEGNETQLRFAAATALGEIGDERGIPVLLEQLGKMGGYESKALSQFGAKAMPQLLARVRSKNGEDKRAAGEAITLMRDKKATPELWKIVKNTQDPARYSAIYPLLETTDKNTSPTSDEVTDYIINNASQNLQFQAIAISVAQRKKDIPYLIKAFQNQSIDHGQRTAAIIALGELKDVAAVPALEKALEDSDKEIRYLAARALKRITGKEYPQK